MGRADFLPDDPNQPIRLSVVRLRFVDGDYDQGGAYWGNSGGTYIYRAVGDSPGSVDPVVELYVRARSRLEARALIAASIPGAKFYR
jgi:hypothetical protein